MAESGVQWLGFLPLLTPGPRLLGNDGREFGNKAFTGHDMDTIRTRT